MSRSCALGPISRNVRSSAPQEQHQGTKLMTQSSQSLSQKHGLKYLASSFDFFKVSAESPEHSNNGYSITYNIFTHGRLPCLEPENQCPYISTPRPWTRAKMPRSSQRRSSPCQWCGPPQPSQRTQPGWCILLDWNIHLAKGVKGLRSLRGKNMWNSVESANSGGN